MGNTNSIIECRGCTFQDTDIYLSTDAINKIKCIECKFERIKFYINTNGSSSNLDIKSQSIAVNNQSQPPPPIPSQRPLISNISTLQSRQPLIPNNNINNYNNNNYNKQHINFGYNNNENSITPPPRNENDNEKEEEKQQSILLTPLSEKNDNDNENGEKKHQSPSNKNNNQEGKPQYTNQTINNNSNNYSNDNNSNNNNNDNDNNYVQRYKDFDYDLIILNVFNTNNKHKIKNIIINDIRTIKKEIIKKQKLISIMKRKINQITNISSIQINPAPINPLTGNPINVLFGGNDDLIILLDIGLSMFNDGSEVEPEHTNNTVQGILDTYHTYNGYNELKVLKLWSFQLSDYYKICNDSSIEIDANLRIRYTNTSDSKRQKIYTKFTIKVKILYNNVKNNHKHY